MTFPEWLERNHQPGTRLSALVQRLDSALDELETFVALRAHLVARGASADDLAVLREAWRRYQEWRWWRDRGASKTRLRRVAGDDR